MMSTLWWMSLLAEARPPLSCACRSCRASLDGSRTCSNWKGSRWWQTYCLRAPERGNGCMSHRWHECCSCSASTKWQTVFYKNPHLKTFRVYKPFRNVFKVITGPPWTPWGCTSHSLAWRCPACCKWGGLVCSGGLPLTLPMVGSGGDSMWRPELTGGLLQRNWLSPQLPAGTR